MTPLNAASIEVTGTAPTKEQVVSVNTMNGGTVTNAAAGGGQSFPNMQPSLAVNFIIALTGIFPSRI